MEKAKINIVEFFRQVKQEGYKVSWPTRKETMISTGLVLLVSVIFAIFFLVADVAISKTIQLIMSI